MAKIVDLSVIQQEPLIFKMPPDCETEIKEFTVPGEISTQFVFKLYKLYEDMNSKKDIDDLERLEIMKQIVIEILNLDKENGQKVDVKFINDNLDDLRYLQLIIEGMMQHITEIQQNENLNSPKSDK